jgi:hypothetical protein
MREIVLPNSAAIRAPGHAVGGADWTIHQGSTAIRFHPNWCYLQPWVLAALASWGQRQLSGGGAITVENDRRAAYAWRFGLHEFLGFEPERLPEEHEEAGRFLSLRAIATSADLSALLADLVPLLHLGDEPERARAVQYAMSEMVTNNRAQRLGRGRGRMRTVLPWQDSRFPSLRVHRNRGHGSGCQNKPCDELSRLGIG